MKRNLSFASPIDCMQLITDILDDVYALEIMLYQIDLNHQCYGYCIDQIKPNLNSLYQLLHGYNPLWHQKEYEKHRMKQSPKHIPTEDKK